MKVSDQIENRVLEASFGNVFIISDFTDLTNYDNARKVLSRLSDRGSISKITRGVYYKPKYSTLLNEPIAPDMNKIAEAIARNFGWIITPSGDTALNQLGISTQVPGRYCYISSGPYRTFSINNTDIEFLHRNDKDINGKSYRTRMIIQAIKAIGQKRIEVYIPIFQSKLTDEDKSLLLKEGQRTTAWVYEIIKEIVKEGSHVSNS